MSEVKQVPTRWLWFPYIPYGRVTFFEGDPGIGKSWLTCAIAKAVANGELLPGQEIMRPPQPKKVLLASAEDDAADTVGPRLTAMGANLENIISVTEPFFLDPDGLGRLEATVKQHDIKLIIVDPLVAYLGDKVDMHRANEVRPMLAGLYYLAKKYQLAVVIVRHYRKGEAENVLHKGQGSYDFAAAVRSIIQVEWAKNGKDRIMWHVKHNGTPKGKPLAYTIVQTDCSIEDNDDGTLQIWVKGEFQWLGEANEDELQPKTVNTTPKLRQQAIDFLIQQLSAGPKPAIEVQTAAVKAGISVKTLTRAKQGLAVSDKIDNVWVWKLVPTLDNLGSDHETDNILH